MNWKRCKSNTSKTNHTARRQGPEKTDNENYHFYTVIAVFYKH